MTHLARLALYPLSVLNALVGFALVVVASSTSAVPVWVAGPAVAVATQGVYSLLWLQRRVALPAVAGDVLFAVGEAVALVVGVVGVIAALVAHGGATDPEYGPPTMLALVAVHAAVGLLTSQSSPNRGTAATS